MSDRGRGDGTPGRQPPAPDERERRVSRRRWLGALAPAAMDVALEALAPTPGAPEPRRRPPGALDERAFLAACTRCHECVAACPHGAIHHFAESAGPPLAGTPVMRPEHRPCHMCAGFPCAAACPEGALRVPETARVSLGVVQLDASRCLAFQGPECGACVGLCPGGTPALRLVASRPQLVAADCVGCGLCIEACVTSPKALTLLPLESEA